MYRIYAFGTMMKDAKNGEKRGEKEHCIEFILLALPFSTSMPSESTIRRWVGYYPVVQTGAFDQTV